MAINLEVIGEVYPMDNLCLECGGALVKDRSGEILCSQCGLVHRETELVYAPKFFYEDQGEKQDNRHIQSTEILLPDMGLGTRIDKLSIHQLNLTDRDKSLHWRMRRWQNKVISNGSDIRSRALAIGDIHRICDKMNLSTAHRRRIMDIYDEAYKHNIVRGRSVIEVVAASVYFVCRLENIPRTLKEIAKVAGLEKGNIARIYRLMHKELDLDPGHHSSAQVIQKAINILKLPQEHFIETIDYIRALKEKDMFFLQGKSPQTKAAASLYIIYRYIHECKVTQKQIADACEITEVSLRNNYKKMLSIIDPKA